MIVDSILYHESFVQSSVNETMAYGPPIVIEAYWGWAGNISFLYWDVTESEGIPGANVTCHLWGTSQNFFDLGNGTYLVEVNTTYLWSQQIYYLVVSFDKTGFEDQVVVTPIFVHTVRTYLEVFASEVNQVNDYPLELVVPLGDLMEIMFFYNDTDASDGYVGGLEGAHGYTRIVGPTLVEHFIELVDLGQGYYNLTFDTNQEWMFESIGGVPTSHELPYLMYVELALENREPWEYLMEITIIDIPTELEITPAVEDLQQYEGQYSMFVSLMDIWPTHDRVPIQGVNITVESSDPTLVEVVSITKDSPEAGVYNITLNEIRSSELGGGCLLYTIPIDLTINIEKNGYESQSQVITVYVSQGGGGRPPNPGFPTSLIVILIVGILYFRNKRKLRATEELPGNE